MGAGIAIGVTSDAVFGIIFDRIALGVALSLVVAVIISNSSSKN